MTNNYKMGDEIWFFSCEDNEVINLDYFAICSEEIESKHAAIWLNEHSSKMQYFKTRKMALDALKRIVEKIITDYEVEEKE